MRPSLKYFKNDSLTKFGHGEENLHWTNFLGYQFTIKVRIQIKIVVDNSKSKEDNDTYSNDKDKRKRARATTVRIETATWTSRAASSIVFVRRSRSEAKSSKLLQREWKSWLFSWSDLQSNFVKHIVQSVRVDCEVSAHSASSCAWEHSVTTWENFIILTRAADPSVDRESRRSLKHCAQKYEYACECALS